MSKRVKFITVEGGEGAGKSTAIEYIKEKFRENCIDFITTREPGGSEISEKIRKILLDKHEETMCAEAELLLIFAARMQHIQATIKPALESGQWVICDRFLDATYAYQGAGRKLADDSIAILERQYLKSFKPDITLYLDVSVDTGLSRAMKRAELDRFESEKRQFFIDVQSGYKKRIDAEPERFCVIDAEQTMQQVKHSVRAAVEKWIQHA